MCVRLEVDSRGVTRNPVASSESAAFVFSRLNYFDRKTLVRLAVLEVNVLRRFIETNRVS